MREGKRARGMKQEDKRREGKFVTFLFSFRFPSVNALKFSKTRSWKVNRSRGIDLSSLEHLLIRRHLNDSMKKNRNQIQNAS